MPNSDLINKYFTPPDKVLNKIESALGKVDLNKKDIKGFRRGKEILKNKRISYAQMKKIKNFFDNYSGDGFDDEFKLTGGKSMRKWVNDELEAKRGDIHDYKQTKMDAGEENQFIRNHEKDHDNANPTGVGMVKIYKGTNLRNIMNNDTVYENIESIKKLIGFLNNK